MAAKTSYGASALEIAELFGDYLEGDASRPALVLSARPLDDIARNAVERSLESFGYAEPTCTFATLSPVSQTMEGGDIVLDPQALFLLVEGIDPLCLVTADAGACAALAQAYRTQIAPDAPTRLFGRPVAAFTNLETLLQSEKGKQNAWRILKTLKG